MSQTITVTPAKAINNLTNCLVEFVSAARDPKVVDRKRRADETAERERLRQAEIARRNRNIVRTPRKLTMTQKLKAQAEAKRQRLDEQQGEMRSIPSPSGSLFARIEPEKVREVVELTWHNNNFMIEFNEAKPEGWTQEDRWTAEMSEFWQLAKQTRVERARLAPRGSALSGCFWGTVLQSLVGEQPKNVNPFDVLTKIPVEHRQEFLSDWLKLFDREDEERQTESNREIDDAGRQDGDGAKNRNHFINEKVA